MKSPFKFLDSYTKEDREIFFGREREIEELYHRVFESKIMLVYGVSGTGKSSLIHCGLANKFSDTDWLPLMIRRGGNMIESFASAIKTASITKQTNECTTPAQFRKAVKSLYLDHYKPVFFIFDQFEELFIFGSKEEKREIIQVIKALVETDIQCRFIFVMREEYMAGITEFEKFIPTIFSNRVRIEKMAHINAIEAINGPCKIADINLEEGFAEALLEKLSPESADVELTYLQVFLDKIFRMAVSENKNSSSNILFSQKMLEKAGNVSDLLGSFLEEQVKELEEPDTGLAILKCFVSLKGTKKQLSEMEVIESSGKFGKDIHDIKVSEYLHILVNIRILRDKDDNEKYELRHDSLATKIFEKITIVEKELLEIYQFLENAFSAFEKRKVLLSQNDLKYISPYEDILFVNKEIGEFIEKSKNELDKIKKRIKRVTISGFVAIFVFSLGNIFRAYHWPFSFESRAIGLIVYVFWFFPIFVYYVIKNKENRTINILFLSFTVLFLGNIYLYNSIIRSTLNTNLRPLRQTHATLFAIGEKIDLEILNIYNRINEESEKNNTPAEYKETATELKNKTDELVNYIQNLKIQLITTSEGTNTPALNGREIDFNKISKLDEKNIPSQILIGGNANGKAFDLKVLIGEYKVYLSNIVRNDSVLTRGFNITLNLDDHKRIMPDGTTEFERWENYNFQTLSMAFTILRLSQMQNDIKRCESEAISYLYDNLISNQVNKGQKK